MCLHRVVLVGAVESVQSGEEFGGHGFFRIPGGKPRHQSFGHTERLCDVRASPPRRPQGPDPPPRTPQGDYCYRFPLAGISKPPQAVIYIRANILVPVVRETVNRLAAGSYRVRDGDGGAAPPHERAHGELCGACGDQRVLHAEVGCVFTAQAVLRRSGVVLAAWANAFHSPRPQRITGRLPPFGSA